MVGLSTFWSQAYGLTERERPTLIRSLPEHHHHSAILTLPYPRNVRNPLCVQGEVIEQVQVLGSGRDSGEDRRTATHVPASQVFPSVLVFLTACG